MQQQRAYTRGLFRQIIILIMGCGLWALPAHAQEELVREVQYGETVGDAFFVDTPAPHEWQFAGQPREILVVTVRRTAGRFTPRVTLQAPDGRLLIPSEEQADSAEQHLVFRDGLPQAGDYRLIVTEHDPQPQSQFIVNEYSLTLSRIGLRRVAPDADLAPLPVLGSEPLPEFFTGELRLDSMLGIAIFGAAEVSQPDPRNEPSRYIVTGTRAVDIDNRNPVSRSMDALAFTEDGLALRRVSQGAVFFTNQNVTELAHVAGYTTIRLENGQLIVTDFYRIEALLAVDGLVVLRMDDGQRIILEGNSFDFRRRGGINGEGPNAEPVNLMQVDGTTIQTDLSAWQTLAALRDDDGYTLRVVYGSDMRVLADSINVDLFGRGNAARPDLNPVDVNTRLIDITLKREDNPLPLEIDPTGMGDVLIQAGRLRVQMLDGRETDEALVVAGQLVIEDEAIRYQRLDGSTTLSLPDNIRIETPRAFVDNPTALPDEADYRPRYYNNLGTHILDYHPDMNVREALVPVNVVNGNFHYSVTDFSVPSHALALEWTRYYNSLAPLAQSPTYLSTGHTSGQLGTRWRHSYQVELDITNAPLGQVRLQLPDGGLYDFTAIDEPLMRFRSDQLLSWTVERVSRLTGEWRAYTTEGMVYEFDRAGRLRRISDVNGHSLLFSPAPRHLVEQQGAAAGFFVTETYGRRLEIYTNEHNQIVLVRDVQGRTIRYAYDGDMLVRVSYPASDQTATYTYRDNRLVEIDDTHSPYHPRMELKYDDETGQLTEYTYNPAGTEFSTTRLLYLRDGGNFVTEISRFVNGAERTYRWTADNQFRLTQWQLPDPLWVYQWNYHLETGRLSEIIQPNRAVLRFNIDEAGYLVNLRDPLFVSVGDYQFNYRTTADNLRLLERIEYPPLEEGTVYEAFTYDEANRLSTISRPINSTPRRREHITRFTYDDMGRLSTIIRQLSEDESIETLYNYDSLGYVSGISEGNGSRAMFYSYDIAGRLRTVVDGRGTRYGLDWDDDRDLIVGLRVTGDNDTAAAAYGYAYDDVGNLAEFVYQDSSEHYAYDGLYHLASVSDGLERVTEYDFDEQGNLLRVTLPDERRLTITYAYNELDFLTSHISASGLRSTYQVENRIEDNRTRYIVTNPAGEHTEYTYDALGRLRQVTAFANGNTNNGAAQPGTKTLDYVLTYDPIGQLTEISEAHVPGGRTLRITYDMLGNPISSAIGTVSTRYTYDNLGRLTSVTDAEDRTTAYTYDALGNVIQAVLPDDTVQTFGYDQNGNLLAFTNGLEHQTQYSYDSLNRLTAMLNPLNERTTYGYNARGNLVAMSNPLGDMVSVTYDAADRLMSAVDAAGNETRLTYDDLDQIIRVTQAGGLLTSDIAYDRDGNIAALTQPGNREFLFGRDSLGRIVNLTNPLGHTTLYAYNTIGAIGRIVDPLGNEQRFSYTGAGRVAGLTDSTIGAYTYTADAIGRLVNINNTGLDQNLAVNARLTYDDTGLVNEIRFGTTVTIGGTQASIFDYEYDAAGRLTRYQPPESEGAWFFAYDAAGQLQRVTDLLGNVTTYSYDSAGRVTEIIRSGEDETADIHESYFYDAAGRVAEYIAPDGLTLPAHRVGLELARPALHVGRA